MGFGVEKGTYDGRGRLTPLSSRDGATRTFTHNPRGLPATATGHQKMNKLTGSCVNS